MKSKTLTKKIKFLTLITLLTINSTAFASVINIKIFDGLRFISGGAGGAAYNFDMRPYLGDLQQNGIQSATLSLGFSDNRDQGGWSTSYTRTVNVDPAFLTRDSFGEMHISGARLDQTRTDTYIDPTEQAFIRSTLFSTGYFFQSNVLPPSPSTRYLDRFIGQTSSAGFRVENIHPQATSGSTVICHSCPILEDSIITQQLYRGDFQGIINLDPQEFRNNIFSNPFETISVVSSIGDFLLRDITLVIEKPTIISSVSEPSSLALLGLGLISTIGFLRRKVNNKIQ